MAAAGIVLGSVAAAAGAGRIVASLLFGTRVLDPSVYIAAALLLSSASAAACYPPARRAAKVDPVEALRE